MLPYVNRMLPYVAFQHRLVSTPRFTWSAVAPTDTQRGREARRERAREGQGYATQTARHTTRQTIGPRLALLCQGERLSRTHARTFTGRDACAHTHNGMRAVCLGAAQHRCRAERRAASRCHADRRAVTRRTVCRKPVSSSASTDADADSRGGTHPPTPAHAHAPGIPACRILRPRGFSPCSTLPAHAHVHIGGRASTHVDVRHFAGTQDARGGEGHAGGGAGREDLVVSAKVRPAEVHGPPLLLIRLRSVACGLGVRKTASAQAQGCERRTDAAAALLPPLTRGSAVSPHTRAAPACESCAQALGGRALAAGCTQRRLPTAAVPCRRAT